MVKKKCDRTKRVWANCSELEDTVRPVHSDSSGLLGTRTLLSSGDSGCPLTGGFMTSFRGRSENSCTCSFSNSSSLVCYGATGWGSMSWTPSLKRTDGNRIGETKDEWNPRLTLTTSNYDDVGELQYELVPSALGRHEPSTRVSRCWRRKSSGNSKRCSPLLSAVKTSLCVCHNVRCMRGGKACSTPTFRV